MFLTESHENSASPETKQLTLHIYLLYYLTLTGQESSPQVKSLVNLIDARLPLTPSLDKAALQSLQLLVQIYSKMGIWPTQLSPEMQERCSKMDLFGNSKLSEYLDEFIYFLFLKKIEKDVQTREGIVVHYRQGEKAILCLDEKQVMSYWGNQKGVVSLAKKVLLFDHKEVILLNKVRFNAFAKKNCKMHYLRKHINHFTKDFEKREEYFDMSYH